MLVAIKKPLEPIVYKEISNTNESLQEIIGGYYEVIRFGKYLCICDEDGRIKGEIENMYSLKLGVFLVGNLIFCEQDGEEFSGIKDREDFEKALQEM